MKGRLQPPTNYLKVKIMPSKYSSTARRPGKAVKKPYNRGGRMRNLRDEEARVIGVQDNAADELRRVRARRPHDAAERRDRRDQLARVGSRERNARDEMHRLRREAAGYQYGGAIGRQAAAMGPAIARRIPHGDDPNQRFRSLRHYLGDRRARGYQYGGAIERQAAAVRPPINVDPAAIQAAIAAVNRRAAVDYPTSPRGPRAVSAPPSWVPWNAAGGRVGFKTGGRIPRKKGGKFI